MLFLDSRPWGGGIRGVDGTGSPYYFVTSLTNAHLPRPFSSMPWGRYVAWAAGGAVNVSWDVGERPFPDGNWDRDHLLFSVVPQSSYPLDDSGPDFSVYPMCDFSGQNLSVVGSDNHTRLQHIASGGVDHKRVLGARPSADRRSVTLTVVVGEEHFYEIGGRWLDRERGFFQWTGIDNNDGTTSLWVDEAHYGEFPREDCPDD